MRRSGSSGVGLATSPRRRQKSIHVTDLGETFLRRQAEDTRHVLQHVRIRRRAESNFAVEAEAGGGNKPRKRRPTRIALPPLDPRNYRLCRAGAFSEISLRQSRPCPRLTEKSRGILFHAGMIAYQLSAFKRLLRARRVDTLPLWRSRGQETSPHVSTTTSRTLLPSDSSSLDSSKRRLARIERHSCDDRVHWPRKPARFFCEFHERRETCFGEADRVDCSMLAAGKLQRVQMRFALRHPSERQLFNSRLQRS